MDLNINKYKGRGLVLAAPHSGAGKTTLTIGLMRALTRRGVQIAPAKIGPDYIDPQFHEIASGQPSLNLDGWAMRQACLSHLGAQLSSGGGLSIIEGVMGLFDGAVKPGVLGHGATSDIAKFFKLPVILVVDCAGMGQSVAALVKGFSEFDRDITISGVILNKLGSLRHVDMMREALAQIGMRVVGAVPRFDDMVLPSRHLGLVQAGEHADIGTRVDLIADHVEAHVDIEELLAAAGDFQSGASTSGISIPGVSTPGASTLSLGQHVAVGFDEAFGFFYPHMKQAWQNEGVTLSFFSPLNDEAPDSQADAVFLPGGYPELFAGELSGNQQFLNGLRDMAQAGKRLYGECGGYMVLGEGLIDKKGNKHAMAGLLSLETSFEKRKLHLGYRHVRDDVGLCFRGHEFHYVSVIREEGKPLYSDVDGDASYGLRLDNVSGSFVHLIDQA